MDKRRVMVFVAGQRFTILTDEDEKYVIDIAAKIDARIASLSISQNITRERAAVLTALDFADDNEQDKRAIVEIREQIKDYVSQIAALTEENTALSEKLDALTAENERLSGDAESLKKKLDASAVYVGEKEELQRKLKKQSEENAVLKAENEQLRTEINTLKDAAKESAAYVGEKEALQARIDKLEAQLRKLEDEKIAQLESAPVEEKPAEEKITSEDDLFFGVPEEPPVKPQKEKKNRHSHEHINPYKQQHMQKKDDQKGYTQQRQYSLFDTDE